MKKLSFTEFKKAANLNEEFATNGGLDVYTSTAPQASVNISDFSPLGIFNIQEEYTNEKFDPFAISSYIEEHPEEDICSSIWDELYDSYLEEFENEI